MAQSYTRQSSFADGDTITAALFNNEYNQLVNAFSYSSTNEATTGHRHNGSAGEGGNIPQIGDLDFLNKIVVDSLLNKDKTKVDCKKSVVYRHFNLPMAEYTAEVDKSLVDEIQLPAYTTYQNRIDMLVQYNGYAITSAETLPQAEHKHKTVVQTLIKSLNVI